MTTAMNSEPSVANFFMQRMLPQTEWLSRLSQLGASEVMAVSEDAL